MSIARWMVVIGGAACVLAGDATAQSAQRFSVQGSGIYAALLGEAYEGFNGGPGFEAQLRFTPGALSFGIGYQYTSHQFVSDPANLRLDGGFFEPRYVIIIGSNTFAPYIAARVAVLRQSYQGGGLRGSTTGVTVNGGGGVLTRLGSRLNLDLGVTYGYATFGESEYRDTAGNTFPFPSGSGSNVMVRAGLAIGIGG
jgi:hypothetical protein